MTATLVDTDILIDFLRGNLKARGFLADQVNNSVVCCSVITIAEIFAGMRASEELATRDLVAGLDVLPLTAEIAEIAGSMKRRTRSHSLELDDCLIAATAVFHNAFLATRNAKHYPFDSLDLIVPDYV